MLVQVPLVLLQATTNMLASSCALAVSPRSAICRSQVFGTHCGDYGHIYASYVLGSCDWSAEGVRKAIDYYRQRCMEVVVVTPRSDEFQDLIADDGICVVRSR